MGTCRRFRCRQTYFPSFLASCCKAAMGDKGFLHAKAYLFHQDSVGPHNRADRLRPFAAIVGSSNFTGPGLVSNRELNLVHRVILPTDEAVDWEAAERARYLEQL